MRTQKRIQNSMLPEILLGSLVFFAMLSTQEAFGQRATLSIQVPRNAVKELKEEGAHSVDLQKYASEQKVNLKDLPHIDIQLKSLGLPGTVFLFINNEPVDSSQIKGESGQTTKVQLKIPSNVGPINEASLRVRGWFSLISGKMDITFRGLEKVEMDTPTVPVVVAPPAPPVAPPVVPPAPIVSEPVPTAPPVVDTAPVVPKPPVVVAPKPPAVTQPPVVTRPPVVVKPPVVVAPPPPAVVVKPPVVQVPKNQCLRGFCVGDAVVNDLGLKGTVAAIGPDPLKTRPGQCILVRWSFAPNLLACRYPGEIDKE